MTRRDEKISSWVLRTKSFNEVQSLLVWLSYLHTNKEYWSNYWHWWSSAKYLSTQFYKLNIDYYFLLIPKGKRKINPQEISINYKMVIPSYIVLFQKSLDFNSPFESKISKDWISIIWFKALIWHWILPTLH